MKKLLLAMVLSAAICTTATAQGQGGGHHFLEMWDLDSNGTVSLEDATERRSDVFASFDANDDGFLDAEEYKVFDEARDNDMKQNGFKQGGTEGRAQAGMKLEFNDLDKDGKVSKEEFLSRTQAWLEMMDRNGDGAVTAKDFGPRNQ